MKNYYLPNNANDDNIGMKSCQNKNTDRVTDVLKDDAQYTAWLI